MEDFNNLYYYYRKSKNLKLTLESLVNKKFKIVTHYPEKEFENSYFMNLESGDELKIYFNYFGRDTKENRLKFLVDESGIVLKKKNSVLPLTKDQRILIRFFLLELLQKYTDNIGNILASDMVDGEIEISLKEVLLNWIEGYVKKKHEEKQAELDILESKFRFKRFIRKFLFKFKLTKKLSNKLRKP